MRVFHSIRWRLQLWHGLLLVGVLAGFGYTAWRLQRATQLQRVDQDLERRVAVIASAIRRGGEAPVRPRPRDRQTADTPPPPTPSEVRLTPRDETQFEGEAGNGFYYVAWLPDGRQVMRSAAAPPEVPRPERGEEPSAARLRGSLREYVRFIGPGECILVGRDIRDEVVASRHFAWILGGAGGLVLLLGLAGGWWVSTRTLRPLAEITATAAKIATGDLSQRIQTADNRSELGALAEVLNDTFARLQAGFTRQAQFTADASHELRTPVAVVLTQTQSALARERSAAEYRDSLAACQRAAQRMRRLTESLLTLARFDAGDAASCDEPCELDCVARDAIELLRPLAEEQGVSLDAGLAPTRCMGNAEQLGQVVTNLVSNAISHNRPGGSVGVTVAADSNTVYLTVSDTGQGIAAEDLPHIFERFYRADRARSNTTVRSGLGLAITQAIVAAHGGSIAVASEPGQGSTFTVRLPISSSEASPQTQDDKTQDAGRRI